MEREDFIDGVPGTELLVDLKKDRDVVEAAEIVCIPTPTTCGADPLGWRRYKKYWQLFVVSLYACCFAYSENNLVATWTTVSVNIDVGTENMRGGSSLYWLLFGFFNVFWIPAAMKIGRRPVFIATTLISACSMVWLGKCSNNAELSLVIILNSVGVAGYEAIIQLFIFDTFFVHERGRALAVYLFSQQIGGIIGLVSRGSRADTVGWNWSRSVAVADVVIFCLFIFTFQESLFPRFLFEKAGRAKSLEQFKSGEIKDLNQSSNPSIQKMTKNEEIEVGLDDSPTKYEAPNIKDFPGPSWKQLLAKWWVYYPDDKVTYWQYLLRPFTLFTFSSMLYSGFCFGFGAATGMLSFSTIAKILMDDPYNFSTSAMCTSSLAGSCLGALIGFLSDYTLIYFAKRNNGVREPELRFCAMIPPYSLLALAYFLCHLVATEKDSWLINSVGIGLMTAHHVSSCSIATSYAMDCFRGSSGEFVGVLAIFSACMKFVVSYLCQGSFSTARYGWLMYFWSFLLYVTSIWAIWILFVGKRWRKLNSERYFKFVEEGKQWRFK